MDWLDPHLAAFAPSHARVLELGCGPGTDTARLVAAGFEVVAADVSPRALETTAGRVGMGRLLRVDHSRPLPFRDAAFEAVVASLSLHYFTREVTRAAFAEVRRVLPRGGVLLFRVNATDDVEHGALEGVEFERNVRRYASGKYGTVKRFFDEPDLREVLDGLFVVESLQHLEIERDGRTKRVWECRARAS